MHKQPKPKLYTLQVTTLRTAMQLHFIYDTFAVILSPDVQWLLYLRDNDYYCMLRPCAAACSLIHAGVHDQ